MLGGETSGSEQKGVMQWTGLKLKAKLKWRRVLNWQGQGLDLNEGETSSEFSVSAKNIFHCTNVNASSLLVLDKLLIGRQIAADKSRLSRSQLLRYL